MRFRIDATREHRNHQERGHEAVHGSQRGRAAKSASDDLGNLDSDLA